MAQLAEGLGSIWRMRSRVTAKHWPLLQRALVVFQTKRILMTSPTPGQGAQRVRGLGLQVLMMVSAGDIMAWSSMNSRWEPSHSRLVSPAYGAC